MYRVCTFSPVLPYQNPDNAGTRLLQHVQKVLGEAGVETLVVVPAGGATQRAAESGSAPRHVAISGGRLSGGAFRQRLRALVLPLAAPQGFALRVLTDSGLRRQVRTADVLEFQWEQLSSLMPLINLLNRRARAVVTLHDVFSQRAARNREAAGSKAARLRWSWALWQARLLERYVVAHADVVLVLSDKDRQLLPTGRVEVLLPPLADDAPILSRIPQEDRLLFVAAMYREDNRDALQWFLEQIWPGIKAERPAARLDVAGASPGKQLERLAHEASDVRLLGFVDDLEPLYSAASAVVVPLRQGAGVKFKVVDALVRGVPVVTTTVGAEGIGDCSWFAGVHDNATAFANAVARVLSNPEAFEGRAANIRAVARNAYGMPAFRTTIQKTYGIFPEDHP